MSDQVEEFEAGVGQKKSRCARCHRALKDPESIEKGMGPVCRRKTVQQPTEEAEA